MIPIARGIEIVQSVAAEKERPDRMPAESVPLSAAMHRILREDVAADADSPPFDKAIRDGFAVRWQDVSQTPAVLEVIAESRAGKAAGIELRPGACCEIMTGAPLPAGADAVVMVEHTERVSPTAVRVLRSVRENEGLLRQAAEIRAGEPILSV